MLLALPLAAVSAAGEETPAPARQGDDLPTWYSQAVGGGDSGLSVTHYWSKGPALRAETVMSGHRIVTIVKGAWYYAFDELSGRGLAIRRDADAVARCLRRSAARGMGVAERGQAARVMGTRGEH